jgi:hypothetical protein
MLVHEGLYVDPLYRPDNLVPGSGKFLRNAMSLVSD